MKPWVVLFLVGLLVATVRAREAPYSVEGGTLRLGLDRFVMERFGARSTGAARRDNIDAQVLKLGTQGSIEFLAPNGHFDTLLGGSIPLRNRLALERDGADVDPGGLRLAPAEGEPLTLAIIDGEGAVWLRLTYGHFMIAGEVLQVTAMDVHAGPGLARALGRPGIVGVWVGTARLETRLQRPIETAVKGEITACSGPLWPTEPGFDADVAMTDIPVVAEVAAGQVAGRVILAPSADFQNVGSADIPWFQMFATPSRDPQFCIDNGSGACEPYGVDQGGILVYAFYRYLDGRLEQLGRSAAKHAFNSINLSCSCAGGRIVWQGCADRYGVNTNADRDHLGPRSEITAHTGIWQRLGSIFDNAPADGVCDNPINDPDFYGGVLCRVPPAGSPPDSVLERRLHVASSDLGNAGARYFIETWYVVRDDIDIFNSMGHREVDPTFTSVWTFPFATAFTPGPVMDSLPELQASDAGSRVHTVDTGEGRFRLFTSVTDLGAGQYQYDLTLMNFDVDRAFDEIDIPRSPGFNVSGLAFFDGDADGGNDWSGSAVGSTINFKAPDGQSLTWGSQVSFRYVGDREPASVSATVGVDQAGSPTTFQVNTLTGVDFVFRDGFESP